MSTTRKYFTIAAIIWLVLAAVVLFGGTIGGICDNIGFKDWFSVKMWAIFGPVGFALSFAGVVMLVRSLLPKE
jgi:hypothetical protein